jgi:acetyl esterase/lipase
VYGEAAVITGGQTKLLLDLYAPEGDTEKNCAVVLLIHGGGFYKGDKTDAPMATLATRFARRGYVTISMNYRLMPSKSEVDTGIARAIRIAVEDARTALRWISENQSAYRMDAARVAIGGGSAGAFTSLATAYGPGKKDIQGIRIRAVIDIWGGLVGAGGIEKSDPPLIIIHGTDDKTVPFHFAERLNTRAKEAGIPCEFHPLPGAGHAAWRNMEQYISWISPFLYRHVIDGNNPK